MSGKSGPSSSLISGVRTQVPAIRPRAASISASVMGRTGGTAAGMGFNVPCRRCRLVSANRKRRQSPLSPLAGRRFSLLLWPARHRQAGSGSAWRDSIWGLAQATRGNRMLAETIVGAAPSAAAARRTQFYLWMAVAMAATAFLGFAPTYWVPMAQGVPERIGVLAVHGTLFFGWTLFAIYQAWLVGSGRVVRHRDVGLIGVSLATAMVIFGVLAAINSAMRAAALNAREAGEAFMIVPLSAVF